MNLIDNLLTKFRAERLALAKKYRFFDTDGAPSCEDEARFTELSRELGYDKADDIYLINYLLDND